MPTLLPRANITFKRDIYEMLGVIAEERRISLSQLVAEMVEMALEFIEDSSLTEIAEGRLKTFSRDDAISIDEMKKWNNSRKKK